MPVVTSNYRPPRWLRHGHLQTVYPVMFRRRIKLAYHRERLELPDGDFLDLDWSRVGAKRVAILSHGLESDSNAGYIRGMASALNAAGWDALAWSFRGCGAEPNRLMRFYHSGETRDLAAIIAHAAADYESIALVGFSLGGNMTLLYLGETPPHPAVVAGIAISAPVDLGASARALDARWDNQVYLRRFLKTLVAKVEAKAILFPDAIDVTGIRRIRTFGEFDDRYTSRLHGFRDASDYYARSSSRPHLRAIDVPTLLLNARDDPFLPDECFPVVEAEANLCLFLEAPAYGGHVGFVGAAGRRRRSFWAERRAVEFLRAHVGDRTGRRQIPGEASPRSQRETSPAMG